jgi:DNA topoisomerase VI subunit B
MFKKSVIAALFSVILTVMLGTSAFAAEEAISPEIAEALAEIEEVNTEIYAEIAITQAEAAALYAKYLSAHANEADAEKRAALTAKYDEKVNALINKLDVKTQEMTRVGVEKATAAGVNVEVVWIPVQFADRVAMIDPIHVVGW